MSRRRIRAHYEQMSRFENGRIIGLKEARWANRRIARHMGLSDAAIRRYRQEWVQRHNGDMFGSGPAMEMSKHEEEILNLFGLLADQHFLAEKLPLEDHLRKVPCGDEQFHQHNVDP
ncbi:hypothetical protein NPIL_497681 [Nephila pilipes]|uniref:Uncharacterized protein n=1 Tax=Nephila pilipes TaxID=299642 RepID=A0A8X6QCB2_NEPPI|nr:hypothetical protein NPIL_497681 [Nephila pilipes]